MATVYNSPVSKGNGSTIESKPGADGLVRRLVDCDLCDGQGLLRVTLHALALRYKRQVQRMINNRREGADMGGSTNG